MTEEPTPMAAEGDPPVVPPNPLPDPPPPPPLVGDPSWYWGPSTKFMVGGQYDVGIGPDRNGA